MDTQSVQVHKRVAQRHPNISAQDVLAAWSNRVVCQIRLGPWPPQYVAVGLDKNGRLIEMVAVCNEASDEVLIFHANTPISESVARELNL